MDERTKRNELMIAVTTALYTNWLIAIADKLDAPIMTNGTLVFSLSLVVLYVYFREAFQSPKIQTWIRFLPMQFLLGTVHLALVISSLVMEGITQGSYVFSAIGLFLWFMMYQQIRRID